MITLLNPHRPALSSISPNRKRQTVPIPQLQLYTPAGNKLDITPDADPDPNHHDLENANLNDDVNVNAQGDGGNNPLIPQIRVREPTPHVVCCEGRYHVWSMDDWLPMPPEMDLGRDSILNYKIVRKLPQQGPHSEVSIRTTVSEGAPVVALAPVTIPAPNPPQSDPKIPQSFPEPEMLSVDLEPSNATADDCPPTPPMDIEEGDSRETDMVLDTPPAISVESIKPQLRLIGHDTAPVSRLSPFTSFVIDKDKAANQEDCAIEVKTELLADYAEQQLELQHSRPGGLLESEPASTQTGEGGIEIVDSHSQRSTGSLYLDLDGYGSQNTTTEEHNSALTSTDTSESLASIQTPSQQSISPASPDKDGDGDGDCELHTLPSCSVLSTAGPAESKDKTNLDIPVAVSQPHSTATSPTIWQKGPRVNPANRSQNHPISFVIPTPIKKLELPCQSEPKRVIEESDHVRAPSKTQVITGTDSFTSEIGASLPMLTPATSQSGLYVARYPQNGSPGFTSRHMNAIACKLDDKCGTPDKTWPQSHHQEDTKPQAQRARHTMALSTILQAEPSPVTHFPSKWRANSSVRPDTAPVAPATPTVGPKSVMSGNTPQTTSACGSILTPIGSSDDQEAAFTPVSRTGRGIVPVSSPVDTVCEANSTPTPARTLAEPKTAKATVKQLKALKTPMVIINEGRARPKTIKPATKRQATSREGDPDPELELSKKKIKTTQPKPRNKTVAAGKKSHLLTSARIANDQEEDLVGPRSRAPALEPLADLTGLSTEDAETICARATKSVESAQATHGIHRLAYTVEELKAIHGFLGPNTDQWVVGKNSMDALKDHLIKAGFQNTRTSGALRCKVRDWRNTMMAPAEPEAQE